MLYIRGQNFIYKKVMEENEMKKFLAGLLIAIMIMSVMPISAFNIVVEAAKEGYYTYTISNGEATITDVDTSISGDVIIPSTLGGYSVTKIGSSAFYYCKKISNITIPEGVTVIGSSAFEECSNLSSIMIPGRVTKIGSQAFYRCENLSSITIPESVTEIGSFAFYYCKKISSITIPEGVTVIGSYTFEGCSNLSSITISGSVTEIGNSAFSYCSKLSSITIPEGVTAIGSWAFSNCSNLSSITIPEGVTAIGNYAFYYCSKLSSITIPGGITRIGEKAFENCDNLISVFYPGNVEKREQITISYGNDTLESATWYNTCSEHVYSSACDSKCDICLEHRVAVGEHLYTGAYDTMCNMCQETRIVNGTEVVRDKVTYSIFPDGDGGTVQVTKCDTTVSGSVVIPERIEGCRITSIKENAFADCKRITKLVIPKSVTSVGNAILQGCSGLLELEIPFVDGKFANLFGNISYGSVSNEIVPLSLKMVTVQGGKIASGSFAGCDSIAIVVLGHGVTDVGV